MNLVTGYGGEPHVTAEQDGSLYGGLFGADEYILPIGKQMKAEAVTANTVRVYDGSAVMQGRHWWIEPDTYIDFAIGNGTSGYKRNDILVAKYTKDTKTGIETITFDTKVGTPGTTAKDPSYAKGDIRYGATNSEMPLFRVVLDGVNISSVTRISPVIPSITGLQESLTDRIKTLETSAAKEYYAKGLRIVRGTQVVKPAANSNRHTLFSKFKAAYGDVATVVVTNGHMEANPLIIIGTAYSTAKDILYVYLSGATSSQFRVNYTIFYNA